jgi:hypothetical protein
MSKTIKYKKEASHGKSKRLSERHEEKTAENHQGKKAGKAGKEK